MLRRKIGGRRDVSEVRDAQLSPGVRTKSHCAVNGLRSREPLQSEEQARPLVAARGTTWRFTRIPVIPGSAKLEALLDACFSIKRNADELCRVHSCVIKPVLVCHRQAHLNIETDLPSPVRRTHGPGRFTTPQRRSAGPRTCTCIEVAHVASIWTDGRKWRCTYIKTH